MMQRTFRRAGKMASKMKNKKNNLREMTKNVSKTVGKLTPGGAIVGTLKDIRDRKSILNKRTPIKKDTRPNRDISSLREKAKKKNQSPQGTKRAPRRIDRSTIEKINKASKDYYKKNNTKRTPYSRTEKPKGRR